MSENLIGKTLANRYHISELIGTGGMASVYKGECNLLNRDVAVKVLRESVKDDADALEGFRKEAQAAASLSHNNIVSVYDIGVEDGFEYMVMEYVKGRTLKKYIQDSGPLPWQEVCDFGIQICQALEAAHAIGVIHRDIKPQNILLTEEHELKVTDFGLAKAATGETLTMGGSAVGSVHYISPEQARGGFTDACSDIYSLGIVLFEMLTGKVPFNSESAVSIALMHIEKEVPSVYEFTRSVPDDLVKVVAKATAKDPISRYQSVTEIINDLRAVLSFEPVEYADIEPVDMGDTRKFNIEDEMSGEQNNQYTGKGESKRQNKKEADKKVDRFSTLMALVTVVVLLVAGFGAFYVLSNGKGIGSVYDNKIPSFVNHTLEEALVLADEKGLIISEELEYSLSDEVEDGKIIMQTPEAGGEIDKDVPMRFVVSIGSIHGDISVPDVTGKMADEAVGAIMDSNLTYIHIYEESDSVEKGVVIRQSPAAGTMIDSENVVTIYISSGKPVEVQAPETEEKVIVPALDGATREEAEIELAKYNLVLISVSKVNSSKKEGTVIFQQPEAGKRVNEQTGVSIVISNGVASTSEFSGPTIPSREIAETDVITEDEGDADDAPVTPAPDSSDEEDSDDKVTKRYTFQMPDGDGTANVKITVDGDTLHESVEQFGEEVSVDITGSDETVKVVAYVNGKIEDEKTIKLKD